MKQLIISKKDLIHNIGIIKSQASSLNDSGEPVKIIAVVKGNGYGLGLVEFAKFLIEHEFDFFAVATTEEAIILKQADIKEKILMLSSTCIQEDIEELLDNDIILTIGSPESAKMVNEIAGKRGIKAKVHIKIDTGMGRYGFLYNKPEELLLAIKECNNIEIDGVFSHFSESFSKKPDWTKSQFNRFMNVIETLKMNDINYGMLHICNSSAFFSYKDMHLNAVRLGSCFLGRMVNGEYGLKRIGHLETKISEIKILPKGYNIGYGNTCKTKRETKIAIIPVGHADGYNIDNKEQKFKFSSKVRNAVKQILINENKRVNIEGIYYKILGQVGMYNIVLDITGSNIEVGQKVNLEMRTIYVDSRIERKYI